MLLQKHLLHPRRSQNATNDRSSEIPNFKFLSGYALYKSTASCEFVNDKYFQNVSYHKLSLSSLLNTPVFTAISSQNFLEYS